MQVMDESKTTDLLYERQARLCQVLADPKRLRLLDRLLGLLGQTVWTDRHGVGVPDTEGRLNLRQHDTLD